MVKVKTAFTVLVMVFLLGIAACSNDDGDEGGTTGTSAKEGSEPILIKTRVAPRT
jgi:ABC-type glycerol-3-phosphate transport system substrate-binding protein